MLSFKKKIEIFTSIVSENQISYADSFNANIEIAGINHDYIFLKQLNSKQEIISWVKKIKSRLVMKEDEAILEDILDDYILCG